MSRLNHILDCIHKYFKDTGASPTKISITSEALDQLRAEIGQDVEFEVYYQEINPADGDPPQVFGIPLTIIPSRQERVR